MGVILCGWSLWVAITTSDKRYESMKASPLLLSLTDVFDGKVLTSSRRIKLYLKTSFPKAKNKSTFTPSFKMPPVVIFLNELSLVNGDICHKCDRAFRIWLLLPEILVFLLSYSKIKVKSYIIICKSWTNEYRKKSYCSLNIFKTWALS